jgi:hypothetical protein
MFTTDGSNMAMRPEMSLAEIAATAWGGAPVQANKIAISIICSPRDGIGATL